MREERIFQSFGEMGMERNEGQLFRLHGSTAMMVESRVRVGDGPGVADSQSRYNYFFMARCTV